MRLESIRIVNFRNHRLLEFSPTPGVTVIHGNNGSGKTSILEAIHYCSLTRGFAGSNDRECLRFDENDFSIDAVFRDCSGDPVQVRVCYGQGGEKQVIVNSQELSSFSRHIGTIPCVTFTPQELSIVSGAPSERRRFIDSALCQHDRGYMSELLQYRRVLQQRNALLAGFDGRPSSDAGLDIWTSQLARHSASIILSRLRFIRKYEPIFIGIHSRLPEGRIPSMLYQCSLGDVDMADEMEVVVRSFIDRYAQIRRVEIQRKQTLAGPHRDDLTLLAEGRDIRKYASQGQQRSYLAAMKIALHHYLAEMVGETPIMLLDDLFSELDASVSDSILSEVEASGQVMITATAPKNGMSIAHFSIETGIQPTGYRHDPPENTASSS